MSARQLIEAAAKAGLSLIVDGQDLVVEAAGQPPEPLIAELREHKPELVALLREAAKAPAQFSDLYPTETDYARRLIDYAGRAGLSLAVKAGRLIIGIGSKSDTDLLGELRTHEHAVLRVLEFPAWHPQPYPKIEPLPPYGAGEPPERFRTAFQEFCQQCPRGVPFRLWEQAAFDAASLFGAWGLQLVTLGWMPGDVLDVPHDGKQGGLAWSLESRPVVALGRHMAQAQDGRIYRRASQ